MRTLIWSLRASTTARTGVVPPSSGGTDLISYLQQTLSLGIVWGLFVPALAERADAAVWSFLRTFPARARFHAAAALSAHAEASPCERVKELLTAECSGSCICCRWSHHRGWHICPRNLRLDHRTADTASAGTLRSTPAPMRVIANKRCRAMFESPEKGDPMFTRIAIMKALHERKLQK